MLQTVSDAVSFTVFIQFVNSVMKWKHMFYKTESTTKPHSSGTVNYRQKQLFVL